MLGIHGVGRAGADYYLSDLARELPTPGGAGRWAGVAAAGLGLEGTFGPDEFRALLRGAHPGTGRPMGRAARRSLPSTSPSAPPMRARCSTSAAWTPWCRLVALHDDVVHGALAYLERHGVSAVRPAGPERSVIAATGVIAGTITPAANRNGDPHLHSHAVIMNPSTESTAGGARRRPRSRRPSEAASACMGRTRGGSAPRSGALDGRARPTRRDRGRRGRVLR